MLGAAAAKLYANVRAGEADAALAKGLAERAAVAAEEATAAELALGLTAEEAQTLKLLRDILVQQPTVRECVRRMLRPQNEFVCAVAEKLARQKKIDTTTVDEVIAVVQSSKLRDIVPSARAFVDSANPPRGHTEALQNFSIDGTPMACAV
jgi:hypothetical protein